MAIAKGTRTSAAVKSESKSSNSPIPKPEIYEAIFALNRDLELVIAGLHRLRKLRFRRGFMDAFAVKVEELCYAANIELFETQKDREMQDWMHWGGLNRDWERQFCDENDVLIEAEILRKKRAKQG